MAREWLERYPQLFGAYDFALTERQPRNHFNEWHVAIHYRRLGYLVLIEKYFCANKRPDQYALYCSMVGWDAVEAVRESRSQPPDLLVYKPDVKQEWFFVEAKAWGESLTKKQQELFPDLERITKRPITLATVQVLR